jgi:signal transduction histidine kinase
MKNKIAFKLTLYFSTALIIFSLIIGGVFVGLFRNHTIELHKMDMEKRASAIADTLSEFLAGGSGHSMMGRQGGYGAYLRYLGDIAMADVWIVDKNLNLAMSGHMASRLYNYWDLPQDAEALVDDVFLGKTSYSKGFSDMLNVSTLTVGTPILYEDQVVGAVLLHSPVEGMNKAIGQGFGILAVSAASALVLSVMLSAGLAHSFAKPLNRMKEAALLIAAGDYSAKTGVKQDDEIGELASTMDILSLRLDEASRQRQKLEELRRNFVANISHELRTPVTVLRGSLEALWDGVVTEPEQVRNYHSQMLEESIYLERLVNDLLDLSRLQNIDFKIDIEELNLCDVLMDAVRSARHMAQKKNVDVHLQLDSQVHAVKGDYGRLRQMLLIILDNAVKFSPEGEVVEVTLKEGEITIRDKGIGIPEEELPYIFDRFYKVKSSENRGGTGLGLAIAKQIADRHDIMLSVNSKAGEGTEFHFRF